MLELQVAGRAGVPNDAVAVVLNVIAIEPNAAGFITVFACGEPTPVASNLNYVANQVVSNSVVARVGSGGKVCIYTQATSHLVVDVDGYFMPGSIQLLPVPRRVVDTRRSPDLLVQLPSRQVAGSVLEVMIAGTPGVPTGARSVAINVTATDGTESGFLTVYPCDQARPNTSNVTYRAGQSVANSVISRLGATGALCVYVTGATFVIIDVAAVIPETTMTTAAAPIRVLDTRSSAVGILAAGSTTELQITGLPGAPATGGAAVLTITAIDPVGSGYLTVFPCGQSVPAASNMNVVQGITVSTTAVAKIGAGGKVCIFTISATHVAVDLTGSFV